MAFPAWKDSNYIKRLTQQLKQVFCWLKRLFKLTFEISGKSLKSIKTDENTRILVKLANRWQWLILKVPEGFQNDEVIGERKKWGLI